MQPLRIALAQIAPRLGLLDENLARHHEIIDEARGKGAGLVVFPELGLTGYLFIRIYGANGTPVTATPNTGYHFVSWSDGLLTASRTELGVTVSLSVTATSAESRAGRTRKSTASARLASSSSSPPTTRSPTCSSMPSSRSSPRSRTRRRW